MNKVIFCETWRKTDRVDHPLLPAMHTLQPSQDLTAAVTAKLKKMLNLSHTKKSSLSSGTATAFLFIYPFYGHFLFVLWWYAGIVEKWQSRKKTECGWLTGEHSTGTLPLS